MTTTTTSPTTGIAVLDPQFSDAERYALGAFLAGYRGITRDAYALELRQFVAWCEQHELKLFSVRWCVAHTGVAAVGDRPPTPVTVRTSRHTRFIPYTRLDPAFQGTLSDVWPPD